VSHLLPEGWNGLFQSVRASAGEAIGGPALADIDPEFMNEPVAEYSPKWQENCEEYIGYVLYRVRLWGLDPSTRNARRLRPLDFDDWLDMRSKRLW
jgi:hypothetical protein